MNPSTDQSSMREYAATQTLYKAPPTDDEIDTGVIPLDSLPAAWWNWYLNKFTINNNASMLTLGNVRDELISLLTQAGIEPSSASTQQIYNAVETIRKRIATASVPGAVISSSDNTSVSVDNETGKMTVNALIDWDSERTIQQRINAVDEKVGDLEDLTTPVTTNIVEALNDVNDRIGIAANFQFFPDYSRAQDWITAWTDENGYAAPANGFFAISLSPAALAVATTTIISVNGVVVHQLVRADSISDGTFYQSTIAWLPVTKGDVVNITLSTGSQVTLTTSLPSSASKYGDVMMRFIPVQTVSDAPKIIADHALSATYLRPEDSDSVRVTADDKGNLQAHTLLLYTGSEYNDGKGD